MPQSRRLPRKSNVLRIGIDRLLDETHSRAKGMARNNSSLQFPGDKATGQGISKVGGKDAETCQVAGRRSPNHLRIFPTVTFSSLFWSSACPSSHPLCDRAAPIP